MRVKFRNIEAERYKLGLTQEQISKLLGTTRPTYSKQIKGLSAFSADQLATLRKLTGKTIDHLLVDYSEKH